MAVVVQGMDGSGGGVGVGGLGGGARSGFNSKTLYKYRIQRHGNTT